jgi:undecaprenyl phosphate-alpha-L-ara4FN deformylase
VTRRVALKVDCDTFIGTREGVPRLLELFQSMGIRATFFFTFGPDRSGLAVRRFITRPGFLKKMLRSKAASLYGFQTALYGTLLPSPIIGERCASEIVSVAAAGHDTGVHVWDHVGWQDGLDGWPEAQVREQTGRAHAAYERLFGKPARSAAAAGWTVTAASLAAEEERALLYTSNSRGGAPFFPEIGGRVFRTLEIPSTLPTLDETLSWGHFESDDDQRGYFRTALDATDVHTIHAEVEGRSKLALFTRILEDWRAAGVSFVALGDLAAEALASREAVPVRSMTRAAFPGRAGTVATGWPNEPEEPLARS